MAKLDLDSIKIRANRMTLGLCLGLFLLSSSFGAAQTTIGGTESQYLSNIRQLIYEGSRSGEGYFSPDGKKLIFQAEREADNPFYQIYILDFETGDVNRVSPGFGKTTCAFFRPRSNEVLFASSHEDPRSRELQKDELDFRASGQKRRYSWDYDPNMELFVANQDGSNLRNVSQAFGYDAEGAFSPDGQYIVFSSNRSAFLGKQIKPDYAQKFEIDPAYFCEVYTMKADGSELKRLTDWPGYDGGTFFSPDGKRIIFRHFNEEGTQAEVYSMKTDGSDRRKLTQFECLSWAPYYYPDQSYVAFAANKEGFGNFEIYLTDSAGVAEPVRATFTDGFDGLPVFSPDGKRLCWTSSRTPNKKAQLFIADWNHAAAKLALSQAPLSQVIASQGQLIPISDHNIDLTEPRITTAELKEAVEILASDSLQGRMTGTEGERKAAVYIRKTFQSSGLQAFNKEYVHEFKFSREVKAIADQTSFSYDHGKKAEALRLNEEYAPLSLSSNGPVDAEAVFVGYGLSVAGVYDSFSDVDLKGKIAVLINGLPEGLTNEQRKALLPQSNIAHKAVRLRERGAVGLIVINNLKAGTKHMPTSTEFAYANSGLIAVSLSSDWLIDRLRFAGANAEALFDSLETGQNTQAVPMIGQIRMQVQLERVEQKGNNIVGYLIPAGKTIENTEFVVLGAHYDHLGQGHLKDASRSPSKMKDEIHNGADDNASGTAAILELAEFFAEEYRKTNNEFQKGIIFACWSGEEMGLIGSQDFVAHLPVNQEHIFANVNFDMIGSLRNNELIIQGVASATEWRSLFEKKNVVAGFNLKMQDDPWLPTDATSFYAQGIPVVNFFTGLTDYYHTSLDDPKTINFEGMTRITSFAALITGELLKSSDNMTYQAFSNPSSSKSRISSGVYLGTIPDYGGNVEGVKLTGVRAGGPAEKAGLQANDVIIELDGNKISNIYDYTHALDALMIEKQADIVVLRKGKKKKLKIMPGSRD